MPKTIRSTQYVAVAASSAKFTNAMVSGYQYMFTANTDCWVLVGATGGSAAADTANNILYIKGQVLFLANPDSDSTTNSFVHVIQDSAGGDATLALIEDV